MIQTTQLDLLRRVFPRTDPLHLQDLMNQGQELLDRYWIPNARQKFLQSNQPVRYLCISESPPVQSRRGAVYFYAEGEEGRRPSIHNRCPLDRFPLPSEDRALIDVRVAASDWYWDKLRDWGFLLVDMFPLPIRWTNKEWRFLSLLPSYFRKLGHLLEGIRWDPKLSIGVAYPILFRVIQNIIRQDPGLLYELPRDLRAIWNKRIKSIADESNSPSFRLWFG